MHFSSLPTWHADNMDLLTLFSSLSAISFGKSSINEMHTEPPFLYDYVTSRNSYCKGVMTSTAESKRVFF